MSEKLETLSKEMRTISVEDRDAIGSAIMKGLISPTALVFERLATEGGDYTQTQGDYTQSGGGDHNQGGGGYNQSKAELFDRSEVMQVVTLGRMLKR